MKIRAFALASFLSAFLLFQIQPMAAKAILPLFGGSNLVWAACMVFFQGTLLLGYAYAHVVQQKAGVRRYAPWHGIVLLLPLLAIPLRFSALPASVLQGAEFLSVLRLLAGMIGLPFFVLSTTSLILQRWLSVTDIPQRENPYVLYSASNLGSLAGLLTYPVFFEPLFSLNTQGHIWGAAYGALAVMHLFCFPRAAITEDRKASSEAKTAVSRFMAWMALSAAACAALLATTNVITFDVASVPFLWVLPLSVYLMTFVLTFKKTAWFPRWISPASYWCMNLGIILYLLARLHSDFPPPLTIALYLVILFFICMQCQGLLVRTKPSDPRALTTFYVAISLGGVIGSILVSWAVPLLSSSPVEYLISFLLAAAAFALAANFQAQGTEDAQEKNACPCHKGGTVFWTAAIVIVLTLLPWGLNLFSDMGLKARMFLIAVLLSLALRRLSRSPWPFAGAVLAVILFLGTAEKAVTGTNAILSFRNFYGIYRLFDSQGTRSLFHGAILHGKQYLDPPLSETPLSYFHPTAPAGEILSREIFPFRRIGMIGLGTGSLATYFHEGQSFTVYEIDRDNVSIAENYFTYLSSARKRGVTIDFVIGDGRISLKKVPAGAYDLLIIDAFTSDAIPIHLITAEAVAEYFRALGPNGLLLMHISNKMLALEPVVFSIAQELGIPAAVKSNTGRVKPDADSSTWAALCRDRKKIYFLYDKMGWAMKKDEHVDLPRPWTDQYSNLFGAMRAEWSLSFGKGL